MVFRPALPLTGVAGSNFLQRTLDRQLNTFSNSPAVQNDREYFQNAFSEGISVDDFISDRRLLRIGLTAFGLVGEESKGGFVRRALESQVNPDDSFLQRINNPDYVRFAAEFEPVDGQITLSAEQVSTILTEFERESFEVAVGDVDTNLRLDLNYRSEIARLAGDGASDEAIAFRLLGSVPIRTVFEGALNLPTEFSQLDVERQADDLQERIKTTFGVSSLSELVEPDKIDQVTRRFLAIQAAQQGPNFSTPGFAALSLFTGVGEIASQNLFLSRFT
ncbi:MAG: DUF1217 domain-containing protein [Pseudomonadota bacterium]